MPRKPSIKSIVKEEPSLERDSTSNAILNTDSRSYLQARSRKKILKKKDAIISELECSVNSVIQRLVLLEKIVANINK